MDNTRSLHNATCAKLMVVAERELAAFLGALTELYGAEQATMSAQVWLDELEATNSLPGATSRDWRTVTIAAFARLASRLTATKIAGNTIARLFFMRASGVRLSSQRIRLTARFGLGFDFQLPTYQFLKENGAAYITTRIKSS